MVGTHIDPEIVSNFGSSWEVLRGIIAETKMENFALLKPKIFHLAHFSLYLEFVKR